MGFSKLDTLEGRPDFIKKFVKSYGKTNDDILAADATETAASTKVAHQGWQIEKINLPKNSNLQNKIISPAELELV